MARRRPTPTSRDIVMVWLDDFSPHAAQLWTDPERTPTLARLTGEGLHLASASGSTPRCCPGRVNLLTGRWSHHSGVTENDMGPFRPRQSVHRRLAPAGYHTLFAGKYLNRLPAYTRDEDGMLPYAAGWDEFDVLWNNHGAFYDYPLWTRDGVQRHGSEARDHSTRVVTERLVDHIRAAPPEQPLFAIASLFHGHDPNLPLRRFDGDPSCAGEAWTSPSYDEEDVSDKPSHIQVLPRLGGAAYDLVSRCEEMLSVEWSVRRILDALEEVDRLDDTLVIFSADNGWLMGEHRIEDKKAPYATPVPLYLWWPARWPAPRTISEPVSSVDIAPTLCALAGCRLPRVDGLDLLPLLDGETDALDRRYVYEESLHDTSITPGWVGLRTTNGYAPDERWVYTEYASGEVELYDLLSDPWQLQNLAGDGATNETETALRELLLTEVVEPNEVRFRG